MKPDAWENRLLDGVRILGPDETTVAGNGFLPEDSEANSYYEATPLRHQPWSEDEDVAE
ncbi:hypothetical protein [Actinacidiphila oryziradicis]|uniref:hypothetical protein n=1 Tax=Actinacidiphila oryziradicis TaxID=2571141 RepID=UPI0023F0EBE2|nr:hypothetical protein [Actinacidiphila oryziradicis]MCW2872364.1 hypothetical protein [Actinacidiphila oryziradicis]